VAPNEHVCRLVRGAAGFREAALGFLSVGLCRHERLVYVGNRSIPELAAELSGLGGVDELVESSTLLLESTKGLYAPGGAFDADEQVARYARLTKQAVLDGYTGLRVAADATAMAMTPSARREFVHYELAVGQLMAQAPLSAMCSYDLDVLGAGAGDLCAVHPHDDAPATISPGFRLCFGRDGLVLSGEIDLSNTELFEHALRAALACAGDRVLIDTAELTFIDVHGIRNLAETREELSLAGRDLLLTSPSSSVRRVAQLLDIEALLDIPEMRNVR
jgi:anti-anti-sigma factor